MPVKRRASKQLRHRITPEAVEAYRAGDYMQLHRALGLMPWECSPLPDEITALGVDQGDPPDWMEPFPHRVADYRQAQELQRQLEGAAKAKVRQYTHAVTLP